MLPSVSWITSVAMMSVQLVLVMCIMCLALVESKDSQFLDDLEIVESEGSDHTSEDLSYTEEVNHVVVPILLDEKTVGNTKELSYMITLDGTRYVLHLVRNPFLVSADFKVFSFTKSKQLYFYEPHIQTKCYYQGYMEDYPNSAVAVSICTGLRGTMQTEEFKYVIEPDGQVEDFSHIVYNAEAFETYVKCDLDTSNALSIRPDMDNIQETNERGTAYVELFMVISQQQFQFHDENATCLIESILELINNVNTVFQPLNTHIVLVGIEIWSEGSPINTDRESAEAILSDFLEWKKKFLDNRVNYDVVGLSLRESTISSSGLAHLGGACNPNNSAFISVMNLDKLVLSSALFVHELGHVLGMKHDTLGCSCQSGKLGCTMVERGLFSTSLSDCSVEDMEAFYASDKASCLWNSPTSDISSVDAKCGNKVLDLWEECDCGSEEFAAEGTPCRIPSTECDLAEYCDGKSSTCPVDVYQQNGSPCNGGESVCFEKTCYDYNRHCQRIFGKSATVAPLSCFQSVNTVGDRFGNCGTDGEMLQCDIEDVMCGRVQCLNWKRNLPNYKQISIITTPVGKSLCWGLDFRYRAWTYDHGAVPDGALCYNGKICLHRKCVDFSMLGFDCDAKTKCSGNGVCNSRKNCHCDMGLAPPHCNTTGYGGSVDSGPLTKNSFIRYISLREAQPHVSSVVRCCDGLVYTMVLFISWLQYVLYQHFISI
ncbi:disintegrin and metalloproteinase domain-containing protein 9-like isoform X2 [Mixophyes fleayi]|uniref:disintegrin and metalloproteinase domain-containing protein 9-like isoform X2 n=1 Tax=Mixophyes fleayi TaxID=3061075 RepID=UPI003F4E37E9